MKITRSFARTFRNKINRNPGCAAELTRLSYQIFLSDPQAARRRGVYFCGLKPYGNRMTVYAPPVDLPPNFSTYRDAPQSSRFYPTARRVIRKALNSTLGPEAPFEAALCTNWFFARAADSKQLKDLGWELADFAEYHKVLLDFFRPRLIVCAGNGAFSPYRGMCDLLDLATTKELPGEGKTRIKIADGADFRVVGFPHFSRFGVSEERLEEVFD